MGPHQPALHFEDVGECHLPTQGPPPRLGRELLGCPHLSPRLSLSLWRGLSPAVSGPRPLNGVCRRARGQAWPTAVLLPGPLGQRGPKGALLITPQITSTLQFAKGSLSFLSVDPLSIPPGGMEFSRPTWLLEAEFGPGPRSLDSSQVQRGLQALLISQYLRKAPLFSGPPFPISPIRGSDWTTSKSLQLQHAQSLPVTEEKTEA